MATNLLYFRGRRYDMNEHLLDFMKNLRAIDEGDFGDFMRKGNLFFLELSEALGTEMSDQAKKKLSEIQDHLQFTPDWNHDTTLHRISKDILDLELILDKTPKDSVSDFHPHFHP